jgi:squalene-associated FAD-dependent desaturase
VSAIANIPRGLRASSFVPATVGIIGGGLAGLAAGCALSDAGYKVTLFERRPYLGGRASSYEHPATGEVLDNCQHILLGCCTNLIDFYRRLGVEDKIRWYNRLTFITPDGRRGEIGASSIPAPFHATPSFLRFGLLGIADKLAIGRAMLALIEQVPRDSKSTSFLQWLRARGQTQRAIDRFWGPILVSALNEELDRISVYYGAMVFRDAFLKSAEAGRMGVPTVPLSDLYGQAAGYITARGGTVHLRAAVESFEPGVNSASVSVNGERWPFDFVIPAVSHQGMERILPETPASDAIRVRLHEFQSSPITGIHLWFDREFTQLDHAVLLDRTIQWMFQKSRIQTGRSSGPLAAGSYLELVISSSKSLVDRNRAEIIDVAMRELAEFFPEAKQARLLKGTVVKEVYATFSPLPGLEAYRPAPASAWPRVFLSGDWINTGWPATMEGAVRAGYASAQSLAGSRGDHRMFLVPDLAPKGLMRLFR